VAEEKKTEELKEEPTKEGAEEELQGESALEDAEKEEKEEKKEKPEEKEDEEKKELKEDAKEEVKEEVKEEAKEEKKEVEVEEEEIELKDQVISIRRVTKVVKGGKNLSFSALAAVGNENGLVGIGKGKAREVPMAIAKAVEDAKKKVVKVPLADTTVPHFIRGEAGGGVVILRPASKGTGVIAGGAVRTIMELAGIKDILTKSIRSNNPVSVAHATMNALQRLKDPETVSKYRGKTKDRIWQ
jgi:small subunit ribosomal protein S5